MVGLPSWQFPEWFQRNAGYVLATGADAFADTFAVLASLLLVMAVLVLPVQNYFEPIMAVRCLHKPMKELETDKLSCRECGSRLRKSQVLEAPNPFDQQYTITGCPYCKEPVVFRVICDEPNCWGEASIGTLMEAGPSERYRNTCHRHAPTTRQPVQQ